VKEQQRQALIYRLTHLRQKLARRIGLNSIQGRLSAIAFFFIIGTVVTISVTSYRFTIEFERQEFQEHFNLLATYMASNAEFGVLIGNKEILGRMADSMLQLDDIQGVIIRGQTDKVLVHRSKAAISVESGVASAPIMAHVMDEAELFQKQQSPDKPLGTVEIVYSLSGLFELQKILAKKYIFVSLFLSLAPVLMYWMVSRAINAPLKQLVKLAHQVSKGNMDVQAHGGTLQETRTLALAINEMLDNLAARRREIQQVNAVMARQQVLAEVGKFSMIVAHEIKNPLAVIKGSMDILTKNNNISPELNSRMNGYIYDEVQRMNKLIEDFLVFSRPSVPNLKLISVDALADKMSQKISLIDGAITINNHVGECGGEGRELKCDIVQFERALLNVVRNAIEASKEAGQVTVAVFCTKKRLNFQVCDGGSGFDPAKAESMFEPFVSTKSKGTGLGLALVKEVIKAHKGSVAIKNRPEGGACFTLKLTLVDTDLNQSKEI